MKNLIRKILKEEYEDDYSWIGDPFRVDQKVVDYLNQNFKIEKIHKGPYIGKPFIMIDDKFYFLENNKKEITNRLYFELEEIFGHLEYGVLRRSIRNYLNSYSSSSE